jgi:hypothetical protein
LQADKDGGIRYLLAMLRKLLTAFLIAALAAPVVQTGGALAATETLYGAASAPDCNCPAGEKGNCDPRQSGGCSAGADCAALCASPQALFVGRAGVPHRLLCGKVELPNSLALPSLGMAAPPFRPPRASIPA